MATFEEQVEGLTSLSLDGSSAPTQTELTQFLTDGAKEVINVLPANLIDLCAASQSFTSGTADTLKTGKVLRVFRSDGDIKQPCRKVDAMQKGRFSDNEDMNYATVTDPVYYIENNSLDILPVGGSATYSEVQYPAVAFGDSAIAVFPDEAEYLVPLYAAVKSLQNAMGNKTSDLPSDITFPAIAGPPESPSFDTGAISISSSVPVYLKPVKSQTAFSSYTSGLSETDPGIFSITAVAPAAPSLSTTSVSFTQTAPSYTKPAVAPDFAQVNTYIDTSEDIELASSKLQEIGSQLSEYQANIQNELNEYGKESAVYQAQLQVSIQNAQFDNDEDARVLKKYQAEVQKYQADVSKEVQEYSQKLAQYQLELSTSYQAWAKTESDNIQMFQTDIQNSLNKFNEENTAFQNELQEKTQEARNQQTKDSSEYSVKLQKYSNQMQSYAAEVSKSVQDFNSKLQKHTTGYGWLGGQQAKLQQDYDKGLQMLMGGGAMPR